MTSRMAEHIKEFSGLNQDGRIRAQKEVEERIQRGQWSRVEVFLSLQACPGVLMVNLRVPNEDFNQVIAGLWDPEQEAHAIPTSQIEAWWTATGVLEAMAISRHAWPQPEAVECGVHQGFNEVLHRLYLERPCEERAKTALQIFEKHWPIAYREYVIRWNMILHTRWPGAFDKAEAIKAWMKQDQRMASVMNALWSIEDRGTRQGLEELLLAPGKIFPINGRF